MEKLFFYMDTYFDQIQNIKPNEVSWSCFIYVFILVCLAVSILTIILIPVLLAYIVFDTYFDLKDTRSRMNGFSVKNKKDYPVYDMQGIHGKYVKTYTNLVKSSCALLTWNILSMLYIVTAFDNIHSGLIEYFYFPFKVLRLLKNKDFLDSIMESNFHFMLSIVGLTFLVFIICQFPGSYFGKKTFQKWQFSNELT